MSTKVGRLLTPCAKEEVNGMFFVQTPQVRFDYDYSYDGVMRSYEDSLKRIGVDRVDILYVHDICAFAHGGREGSEARIRELMDSGGWRALAELRDSGEVKAIGAGVNEWEPCARLLELADPDLFLIAGRYTLLEQAPIDTLFPQCASAAVWGSWPVARITQGYSRVAPRTTMRTRRPRWWRARARWTPCVSHTVSICRPRHCSSSSQIRWSSVSSRAVRT